jgi:hypothetical protein
MIGSGLNESALMTALARVNEINIIRSRLDDLSIWILSSKNSYSSLCCNYINRWINPTALVLCRKYYINKLINRVKITTQSRICKCQSVHVTQYFFSWSSPVSPHLNPLPLCFLQVIFNIHQFRHFFLPNKHNKLG